uniref:Uncharacterized protein n=1 Tax=Oryza brachyantha TaxID=4533 RepID=J3LW39_ORYBR
MWMEESIQKKTRVPNGIVTCILRDRYPEALFIPEDGSESVGRMEPATNWKHYQAAVDPLEEYGNLLERVEADFWARYRWKEGHEAHAKKVLFNVIKNKIGQMLYWTLIQAVLRYYKEILKIPMKEEEACTIYLTQEQYIQGQKEGREISRLEGYIYGHRSKTSQDPNVLCNDNSTNRLASYKGVLRKKHGPTCDWMNQPIDGSAVYQACGGKKHGRFGICDGLISTSSVLHNVRAETSSGERVQQERDRLDREVDERINKTLEDRMSQLEERNRVQNNQAQEQIREQVAAAVHATNEHWLKYIQH